VRKLSASSVVVLRDDVFRDASMLELLRQSNATFALRSRGGASEDAAAYLARRIEGIDIEVALPQTLTGVSTVFGVRPDAGQVTLDYVQRVRQQFRTIANVRVLPESGTPTTNADAIRQKLGTASARLLLVVAHNERGTLKFADGSTLSVVDLHAVAARSQRPVLVLSCDTIAAGAVVRSDTAAVTLRSLDFLAIANAVKAAQDRAAAGEATVAEILAGMDGLGKESADSSGRTARILAIIVAGGLVAIAGSLAFWACEENGGC
jgi:hypothetical protein